MLGFHCHTSLKENIYLFLLFVLNRRRDILTIRNETMVREVVQGTQMLAAKLDDPSLLPVTHIVERNQSHKLSSDIKT